MNPLELQVSEAANRQRRKDRMTPYTDMTVLLDRSGSMESIKEAMIAGFDEFVTIHRKEPSTRLTLIQFDGENSQDVVYTARPICEVGKLRLEPRGWTPLCDAFATAIDNTGTRFVQTPAAARPTGILFVLITDGAENYSSRYTRSDCFGRVKHQEAKYGWQFIYLGANQDAIGEAARLGIKMQNAIDFMPSRLGTTNVMRGMSATTTAYTTSISSGASQAASASFLNYQDAERQAAADENEALQRKAANLVTK